MKSQRFTYLFVFFLINASILSAQPNLGRWQWANKAGGADNTSSGDNEVVNDICTDKYGNVYITGIVNQNPYFGTVGYTYPFASFGRDDAFVAKYDKCGNLKWTRFGGGIADDGSNSIHVDDSLNVYILGYLGSNNATFPDSTHTVTIPDGGLFWAKYDSVGNIKWVNASSSAYTSSQINNISLIPAPNGNLSTIIIMGIGAFYTGFSFIGTHYGLGIFEFDLNGNPVSLIPIDSMVTSTNFTTAFNDIYGMAYDSKGNIIFSIDLTDTTKIYDTILNDNLSSFTRYFLMKVNPQSNKIIWIKEWKEDQFGESGFGPLLIDRNDNIFAGGQGGIDAVFNGDSIKFNSTATTTQACVFKLDSNGSTVWYIIADNTNSANEGVYAEPISPYGDQYICTPINVSGPTYWGGDTFDLNGGIYLNTFINTNTGKVEYGDTLVGSNTLNASIFKIISDPQGNLYLGGDFSATLTAGNTIAYTGGINDAYILKWGLPCPDTDALIPPLDPNNLVAYASGLHAIDVNWQIVAQYTDRYRIYRSATDSLTGYSLIDSVSNTTNQFTDVNVMANQIYWYRVSAVNNAGETFSNSDSAVIIPNGITDLNSAVRHIEVYPNPANSYTKISIWSDASLSFSASISLTDMEGRETYTTLAEILPGKNDFILDLSDAGAGVYVVNVKSDEGTYSKRLVIVK